MENSGVRLRFSGVRQGGTVDVCINISGLVIAGWAGRDVASMEAHIRELEEIGVARPRRTPMFYRVAASLLTQKEAIQVSGNGSSGEAEVVIIAGAGGPWVALGSDHTDRKLEAVGVSWSKQLCDKPVSRECWHLDDVRPHWDRLTLRCTIANGGEKRLYQEGSLAGLRMPDDLLGLYAAEGGRFGEGSAMFCGTVPVHGGLEFSEVVMLELIDPVLDRRLAHSYRVEALEIVD